MAEWVFPAPPYFFGKELRNETKENRNDGFSRKRRYYRPCYNRDVWCRMTDVKIRNGVYTCIAWHHKDKGTFDNGEPYCYDVIGIIGIYLDGVIPCQKDMKEIGSIGVDAGLAGFFHNKPDYTDDEWAAFCDRVRHGDAWLIKEGFYSSSGYGDGCYGVYAYEQGGEITAIEIRFL